MSNRQQFRDGEKHLSQIPALHLLRKDVTEMGHALKGRGGPSAAREALHSVLLEDILRGQLTKLNAIEHRGRRYPFSEANILTAIEKMRYPDPLG